MPKSTSKMAAGAVKARGASRRSAPIRDKTRRFRDREERVAAVMAAAKRSGLLAKRSGRIAGRVSPALVEQAKRRTGIEADTELIAFALASVALEDDFGDAFRKARGKIDPDLKLGF